MKTDVKQFSYVAHLPNGQQLALNFALVKDANYLVAVREYRALSVQAIADFDAELAEGTKN